MSLEDETLELSLLYHGQREYVEELQQLLREALPLVEKAPLSGHMMTNPAWQDYAEKQISWLAHAKALLGQALEGEG